MEIRKECCKPIYKPFLNRFPTLFLLTILLVFTVPPAGLMAYYGGDDIPCIEDAFDSDTGNWEGPAQFIVESDALNFKGTSTYSGTTNFSDGATIVWNGGSDPGGETPAITHTNYFENFYTGVSGGFLNGRNQCEWGLFVCQRSNNIGTRDAVRFWLHDEGWYAIDTTTSGKVEMVVDWTQSAEIQPGAENFLRIDKKYDQFHFFINGTLVYQGKIPNQPGGAISLYANNVTDVIFDDFIITDSSNAGYLSQYDYYLQPGQSWICCIGYYACSVSISNSAVVSYLPIYGDYIFGGAGKPYTEHQLTAESIGKADILVLKNSYVALNSIIVADPLSSASPAADAEINLANTNGNITFSCDPFPGAAVYSLNIVLKDVLTGMETPLQVPFYNNAVTLGIDAAIWSALELFDVTWFITAFSDANDPDSIIGFSDQRKIFFESAG